MLKREVIKYDFGGGFMGVKKDSKNLYDFGQGSDSVTERVRLKVSLIVIIVAALFLLPVWLLSMSTVFSVMRFLSQPTLYGAVPMWVLIAVVILFIIYINKNRD